MPEWSVYVELDQTHTDENGAIISSCGFWATVDMIVSETSRDQILMRPYLVIEWNSIDHGPSAHAILDVTLDEYVHESTDGTRAAMDAFDKNTAEAIALVMYLCARNADLVGTPTDPDKKASVYGRVKEPASIQVWQVGQRIGPELRAAAARADSEEGDGGRTVRPHIRRAHWHRFWVGPSAGDRRLEMRWVHPMLVGSSDTESITTTTRTVPVV